MDIHFFRRTPQPDAAAQAETDLAAMLMAGELPVSADAALARCTWLLDPAKQIVGYAFGWAPVEGAAAGGELQTLARAAAEAFVHPAHGWTMGTTTLLFDATPAAAVSADWRGLPPTQVMLGLRADQVQPHEMPLVRSLRERGFPILVSGQPPAGAELLDCATHFDVGAGEAGLLEAARTLAPQPLRPIATRMPGWPQFEACALLRVPVLVSPAVEPPESAARRGELQPESLLILRVLQMVQANEDIREIEATLKRDAALTYRLLRHINSPAVGAGVEIESLRHAVAMLGYARLFRWLSMLLGTGQGAGSVPFLMKKAIIRGRFVELLGRELLGARHADNLFLVGMFSLMDRILGIPLPALLEQIQLADGVKLGIVGHTGVYGPFLALACACEGAAAESGALADQLFLTAGQVNAAHFGAIAWAQEVAGAGAAA